MSDPELLAPDEVVSLTVTQLLRLMHQKMCEGMVTAMIGEVLPDEDGPSPMTDPEGVKNWLREEYECLRETISIIRGESQEEHHA